MQFLREASTPAARVEVFTQPRPTTDDAILHCTTPDLVAAFDYAAKLRNAGDLLERDQL